MALNAKRAPSNTLPHLMPPLCRLGKPLAQRTMRIPAQKIGRYGYVEQMSDHQPDIGDRLTDESDQNVEAVNHRDDERQDAQDLYGMVLDVH